MHDDESGNDQQGSWQPPEYVSPWIPASNPDSEDSGRASRDSSAGGGQPDQDGNDTISFGRGPAHGQQGGYPQAGYPPPGYGQPGYGQPGYGGYGPPPGYGHYQWGGYGAPPPPRGGFSRTLAYVAVAVLAAAAGAGAAVALNHSSSPANSASSPFSNGSGSQSNPFGSGGSYNENPSGSGSGGTNSGTGSLNATSIASKVDPGIVDVTSSLVSGDTAEGTGMVLTPGGLVLTNNHVIDQSSSVSATLVSSGKTYTAKVVGYDSTDDVALLQLEGASGLKTVSLSNSSQAKVGEAVLALGNAGGKGGLPSTAQGTIQALDQSIQASDEGADTVENLKGMIETDAPIEAGDSGGPLVNGSGQVVGMDTAANTSSGTMFGGYSDQATQGFAIPINTAMSIADNIKAGKASSTVHLGLAGYLGVSVADASQGCETSGDGGEGGFGGSSGGDQAPVSSGAEICELAGSSSPAGAVGLRAGDVITAVNGTAVSNADGLTALTANTTPGEKFAVTYVNADGAKKTATVTLGAWAK